MRARGQKGDAKFGEIRNIFLVKAPKKHIIYGIMDLLLLLFLN